MTISQNPKMVYIYWHDNIFINLISGLNLGKATMKNCQIWVYVNNLKASNSHRYCFENVQPCIFGINHIWLWCITFFYLLLNLFANGLIGIFTSMFIRKIGLWFPFVYVSKRFFVLGICQPHTMSSFSIAWMTLIRKYGILWMVFRILQWSHLDLEDFILLIPFFKRSSCRFSIVLFFLFHFYWNIIDN